jgi:hypothetical protein
MSRLTITLSEARYRALKEASAKRAKDEGMRGRVLTPREFVELRIAGASGEAYENRHLGTPGKPVMEKSATYLAASSRTPRAVYGKR